MSWGCGDIEGGIRDRTWISGCFVLGVSLRLSFQEGVFFFCLVTVCLSFQQIGSWFYWVLSHLSHQCNTIRAVQSARDRGGLSS